MKRECQVEYNPARDLDAVLPGGRRNRLLTGEDDPVARWQQVAKSQGVKPDDFYAYSLWLRENYPGTE